MGDGWQLVSVGVLFGAVAALFGILSWLRVGKSNRLMEKNNQLNADNLAIATERNDVRFSVSWAGNGAIVLRNEGEDEALEVSFECEVFPSDPFRETLRASWDSFPGGRKQKIGTQALLDAMREYKAAQSKPATRTVAGGFEVPDFSSVTRSGIWEMWWSVRWKTPAGVWCDFEDKEVAP